MLEISPTNQIIGSTYSTIVPNIYEQFKNDRDAEVFEKLVLDLMLNKYSDDKELTDYVLSLPKDKQRMAVLAVIDGDNVLWSKMNSFINGCSDKFEHIKDVIKIINQFVKDGEVERKKYGEVMTPISLVREMLDTLPKEVWSNPNLKWLDPANGAGTFPFVVVYKLMIGLKDWQPDVELRYKHIVENMIYTCELQSRNVFLWLCGIDPKDEYTTNSYWGSFLDNSFDYHMKNVWGVKKFDIIIGNPPYQEHKEGNKKSSALWDKFVNKSLLFILNELGYLVLVHPGGWRNFGGKFKDTQNLLTQREMIFLNINTYKDGLDVFGAKTDFDFYCLRNNLNTNIETMIVTIDDKIELVDLKKYPFIPGCNLSEIYSLIAKSDEEKVDILFNSSYHHQRPHMSKEKINEFKYTCLQNINVKDEISCVWYSNTDKKGHFGIPKVVFSRKSSGLFIDYKGEYGLAEDCGAIIDDIENLLLIKKAMKNKHFIENIMCFRNNLGDKYNKKILSTFRKDFWKKFI